MIGGIDAQYRKYFEKHIEYDYGSFIQNSQRLGRFLYGYGHYQRLLDLLLKHPNDSARNTSDWHMAIKQYMFWVTQNWEEGVLITLSPS